MLVREFQDCHLGSHVGYKLIMFYVILNLHVALMKWHMVLEEMLFEKKMKWPSVEPVTLDI